MNEITVIVKEGHTLTDYDFYILHETYEHGTEFIDTVMLTFEDNIIYKN